MAQSNILFTKKGAATMEGAGVRLKRVISGDETELCDPFLLFDDFSSDDPKDYLSGFPWHPHRGIETVTYMLSGNVEHEDSLGNKGTIGPGDVQWMTAGSGIIHQEMPKSSKTLAGFQLWVNIPAKYKMINPKYRGIVSDEIPTIDMAGVKIRLICGSLGGHAGPIRETFTDAEYFDISIPPSKSFTHEFKQGTTALCYVIDGEALFGSITCKKGTLVLYDRTGTELTVKATDDGTARVLLLTGRPIKEPIAWYGPIVMNTDAEIQVAIQQLKDGTFIKHNSAQDMGLE